MACGARTSARPPATLPPSMRTATGRAFARAALAGNPSDGFGGATLAVPIRELAAEVELGTAAPPAAARRPHAAAPPVDPEAARLVAAARRRLALEVALPPTTTLAVRTTIP